jgi:hypothetical protein
MSEHSRAMKSSLHTARGGATRANAAHGGNKLPPMLRDEMQARFGADFGGVRLHDDAGARARAGELNARAYTMGEDITLGAKAPPLDTQAGKKLIAHELAHVVQQRRGGLPPPLTANAPHEQAADRAAAAAVGGAPGPVAVGGGTAVGVARQPEDDDPDPEAEKRERDKRRTQRRKQDRANAGKDEDQIADQRARRERRKLEGDAAKPGAKSRSDQRKLDALKRFDDVSKDINEPQLRKNQRKGAFDEAQRTPTQTAGKPQDKYVAGGSQLPDQDLRPGQDSYAQPDYSKQGAAGGKAHVNLKSDRVDKMTAGRARATAKRYTAQAIRNIRHLPQGDSIIIRYAHTPNADAQRAILAEHFKSGSPISEVHFGNKSVKNPAFASATSAVTPNTPKLAGTGTQGSAKSPTAPPSVDTQASRTSVSATKSASHSGSNVGARSNVKALRATDQKLLQRLSSRTRASVRLNTRIGGYAGAVGGMLSVVGVADSISDAMTVYRHGTLLPEVRDAANQIRAQAEQVLEAAGEENEEFSMFEYSRIVKALAANGDEQALGEIVDDTGRYAQELAAVMRDLEEKQHALSERGEALHKLARLFELAAKLPRYETASLFSQYMMADSLKGIGNTLNATASIYADAHDLLDYVRQSAEAVGNQAYDEHWDIIYARMAEAQRRIEQERAAAARAPALAPTMRPPLPPMPFVGVVPLPGVFPPWYYPR